MIFLDNHFNENTMVTVLIQVKNYLAEYAKSKFFVQGESYIQFPDSDYMYHVVYNLMSKRPEDVPFDSGNLEIALPHRSRGKDPSTYNFICKSGQDVIEKKLNRLFWAQMHDFIDEQVHEFGQPINESVFLFMRKYNINSITEDALVKSYYRWRAKIRRKIKKRKYEKAYD